MELYVIHSLSVSVSVSVSVCVCICVCVCIIDCKHVVVVVSNDEVNSFVFLILVSVLLLFPLFSPYRFRCHANSYQEST